MAYACPILVKQGIGKGEGTKGLEICLNCSMPGCYLDDRSKAEIRRQTAMELARRGKTYKEIARELGISYYAVDNYFRKKL